MLNPKERNLLARMAGNIAAGLVRHSDYTDISGQVVGPLVARDAADIAVDILEALDTHHAFKNDDGSDNGAAS